jgi:hypothetical protein
VIDQLTQSASAPAVGSKNQPRQVRQIRLVEFFGERPSQYEGALGQQIAERFMKAGYLFGGDARIQTHGQEAAYVPNGVKSAVKIPDFIDRVIHGRGNFE